MHTLQARLENIKLTNKIERLETLLKQKVHTLFMCEAAPLVISI